MTQPETSDIEKLRARAYELVPEMAPLMGISNSEARRRITLADETHLKAALDAYEEQQRWMAEIRKLAG